MYLFTQIIIFQEEANQRPTFNEVISQLDQFTFDNQSINIEFPTAKSIVSEYINSENR